MTKIEFSQHIPIQTRIADRHTRNITQPPPPLEFVPVTIIIGEK